MRIWELMLCFFLLFFLSFGFMRSFLYGVKRYQMNKSAYVKRIKNQTFIERLFYSKFKEEIPKLFLYLYYFIWFAHFASIFLCLFFYLIELPLQVGNIMLKIVYYFDITWILTIGLAFWSPGGKIAYGRWLEKKRGQPKKKK